jgi:hypothetical protein
VFERDGLLDSLNKEGYRNVWELVAEREREREREREQRGSVKGVGRIVASKICKVCVCVCVSSMHPQANRNIHKEREDLSIFLLLTVRACVCV